MRHVSDQMLAEAINSLSEPLFDTHIVEQRILRIHPLAFAYEIIDHQHNDDVFQQFSASFSKRIGSAFPNEVEKVEKVNSTNLGGRDSDNQQWRRLVANVVPR